jgi:hypothetical protein
MRQRGIDMNIGMMNLSENQCQTYLVAMARFTIAVQGDASWLEWSRNILIEVRAMVDLGRANFFGELGWHKQKH